MVRFEIDRHNPKFPKLFQKHKEEDKRCLPTLRELKQNLGCRELVIKQPASKEKAAHVLDDAFFTKAKIFEILLSQDFDKAFIVDNDVECLDTHYDVFKLPSFSAFPHSSYNACFANKKVGVNTGFMVIDRMHAEAFAKVPVDVNFYKQCKEEFANIHALDEFHVANCLHQNDIKPNFVPLHIQKFPIHKETKSKFIHWVSNNLLK